MGTEKSVGLSLGFLAGTTFGSGISFLLGWQSYDLIILVSLCGAAGALAGLKISQKLSFRARQ
ncbi:hypothetical protein [Paenibacillus tuaregi]|uniref:hypothetical protein n=1 Tax=Paenibacillus tuaregi TaxID=1816681 RepID=UPI000838F4F6|nr:hypothetical protein [Paenibacillus tuaregi]